MTENTTEIKFFDLLVLRYQNLPLIGRIDFSRALSTSDKFEIIIRGFSPVYLPDGSREDAPIFLGYTTIDPSTPKVKGSYVKFRWRYQNSNLVDIKERSWISALGTNKAFEAENIQNLSELEEKSINEQLSKIDADWILQLQTELHNKLIAADKEINDQVAKQVTAAIQVLVAREEALDQEKIMIKNELDRISQQDIQLKDKAVNLDVREQELLLQKAALAPLLSLLPSELVNQEVPIADEKIACKNLLTYWLQDQVEKSQSSHQKVALTSYLLALLTAWFEGTLVLLNGPVGVGKTRIVQTTASRLSGTTARATIVPVRPAWLDSSDLLGFYDPSQDFFRPTPFTTALLKASKGSSIERLNLICLDELNLSRIENYGADLLSRLEYGTSDTDAGINGQISLYSEDIAIRQFKKLKQLKEQNPGEAELAATNLQDYPANFTIPRNIVVLGTLNSDETTYELSPKVIDRSFTITFPKSEIANLKSVSAETGKLRTFVSLRDLKNSIEQVSVDQYVPQWETIVNIDNKYLRGGLGIALSYRARRQFGSFMSVGQVIGISAEETLGHFIFCKLLPRVRFSKDSKGFDKKQSTADLAKEFLAVVKKTYTAYDPSNIIDMLQHQVDDEAKRLVNYFGGSI